jgi:hypothetical protein
MIQDANVKHLDGGISSLKIAFDLSRVGKPQDQLSTAVLTTGVDPTTAQLQALGYTGPQEGMLYWHKTDQVWRYRNSSAWASLSGSGSTLDGSYNFGGAGLGRTITVDQGAVTFAGHHATNNVLAVTNHDGTGNVIDIANTGTGKDIDGTGSLWSVTKLGAGAFASLGTTAGLTVGSGLTVTAGGATITAGGLTVTLGGITSTGVTSLTGALTQTGNADIVGDLDITGDITFEDALVSGTISCTGGLLLLDNIALGIGTASGEHTLKSNGTSTFLSASVADKMVVVGNDGTVSTNNLDLKLHGSGSSDIGRD